MLLVIDSSPKDNVVALHFFAVPLAGDGLQADVSDIVLGTGMGATGEVDVDGLVHLNAFGEVFAQKDGLSLGISSGEFATGVPGAGD